MGNRPLFILNRRLALCADMVRPGTKMADIGTDHAYLPIWMAKSGSICHAIAADLKESPLESARRNIIKYHVEQIVEARLSNGLQSISPNEADDIVIAGMGGEVIEEILTAAPWLKDSNKRLILQAMTCAEKLRLFLAKEGYQLCSERAVQCEGRAYTVMMAHYSPQTISYDEEYVYIGLLERDMLEYPMDKSAAQQYILHEVRNLEKRLKGLVVRGQEEQAQQLSRIIKQIKEKAE